MDVWTLETLGLEAAALFRLGWTALAIWTAVGVLRRSLRTTARFRATDNAFGGRDRG
jgi:hypothetical protein